MTTLAIIDVDLHLGRFGHGVSLLDDLAGKTVLGHTIDRVAEIEGVERIVLMHPSDQSLTGLFDDKVNGVPITTAIAEHREQDAWLRGVIGSGRKWSLTAWRGGIGGMTIYDELLPAHAFLKVMQAHDAESLLAVRGDWCCVDPSLASEQLALHRSAPEAMKLTFTQAPPGLSPLVAHRGVVEDMVAHNATVANVLCYNPKKPVIDPVGKDVNVQVPASVRMQYRRFIYDTPRAIDHLRTIADRLGEAFAEADAVAVTDASRAIERDEPWREAERLPQQLNVELSPRRSVAGPIVPQHYLALPREDMSQETIDALLDAVGKRASTDPLAKTVPDTFFDTAVLFGGLGDPLLHERVFETLRRTIDAGVLGVGIETDLLVDDEAIDRLATLPLDVIAVRLNADSAATYEALMGVDGYEKVMDNFQRLFKARNVNRQNGEGFCGWIVPRLVKVSENLSDLETFFERWMTVSGWAVVDRAKTGRGLIPDLSPVPMEVPGAVLGGESVVPPKQRLTVLSDGKVCLCGEDWLGRLPLGDLNERGLGDLWRSAGALADGGVGVSCVCPSCARWLEAQRARLASA
jgi:hypothetical protein